jgi:hypothetical protein
MNPTLHMDVDYQVREHGRRWAVCRTCGAQWAIHKSNRGEDFEQVTEGDGYCEMRADAFVPAWCYGEG